VPVKQDNTCLLQLLPSQTLSFSPSVLPLGDVQDAVSVALGGVVSRGDLAHLVAAAADSGPASERLLLEDPLTGQS